MNFQKKYLKIFAVLGAAFLCSQVLMTNIFIANSPQIRSDAVSYIVSRMTGLIPSNIAFFTKSPAEELKNVPLQMVSRGVYAKSRENVSYTEVREGEVEWQLYSFVVDGKTIKIKVPKGHAPPSQESVQDLK